MYEYYVKEVTKIVDGDTIDVIMDLGFDVMFKSRVRMAGIDTPESRTRDLAEKKLGLEAKEYLKHAIESATDIVIKTEKMNSSEKYGRILGWVFLDGSDISINDEMIQKGYAWGYLGDTKIKNFSELLAKRNENK
jgi:micrococcal nuclease